MILSKLCLFPYYLALKIRNSRYDKGKKKTFTFNVPIISVGNVNTGGTGKTPMTELIVRELKPYYKVAVLSMGYKRGTKGFRMVQTDDTAASVGDEPLQIKRKFPDISVAVDKKRERGVELLMALPPETRPDVILLDDGFQYRALEHMKDVVLVDYNKPVFKDQLVPLGHLRDLPQSIRRAGAVVITKCPPYLDEWERAKMMQLDRICGSQEVFFSTVRYCAPKAVFDEGDNRYIYSKEVYIFSGIADDNPLVFHLSDSYEKIFHKTFSDHHKFTPSDIRELRHFAKQHPLALLLTTEKDSQRLLHCGRLGDEVKKRLFYLPIETEFLTVEERRSFVSWLVAGLPLPEVKKKPASRSRRKAPVHPEDSPEWNTLF